MDEILRLFSPNLKKEIEASLANKWTTLQEIRVRLAQPIELIFDDHETWLTNLIPTEEDGMYLLNQLSQFSLYRLEDELREGFITIEGGHRVGLAGKVNTLNGSVKAIKHISFFNIRIAKEKVGISRRYIQYLYKSSYLNTLIIGPPQTGKTTLLRDFARIISTGWQDVKPLKTGIVDERSEIGGSINGIPQHQLGLRTDLMDACPKAEGLMMMIRSMSPDVLVVDEIGNSDDVNALMEAMHAGVRILCSVHGESLEQLRKRPSLKVLFDHEVFDRFVILSRTKRPGMIEKIVTKEGQNIFKKPRCESNEMDRSTSIIKRHHVGGV
ncbi:stage III sporulation protein AA [Aquibacillus salsiterrae]|uniref:Stage III sporulation protein AA n=1 Tax=Aquibacillus salsiterrae TaxID=2950439 RepID=A0A9X4ADP2_9BACI|nr:stage III sporulation protein AA [Aquibacillus salsiterrae]MDC3415494.1 stage III sporulation protein AA [Aquibacillus salsiterrae]